MGRRNGHTWKWFVAVIPALSLLAVTGSTVNAAAGDISLFAGNYALGFAGDGGPATSARLNGPTGVAVAADGRVFIADRANDRIRMVATDGTITTFVGGLTKPVDVAVDDAAGLLYISEDGDPFLNRLSKVDISGGPAVPVVIAGGASTGYAGDGGPASAAVFRSISGIGIGPDGDVYIADRGNNLIRRLDVATGDIDRFAGTGAGGGTNGDALTVATFAGPKDVAVTADGKAYVADEGTNLVRLVDGGNVSQFAGNYTSGFSGDGGPATGAQLNSPDGVTVGPNGDVYIADTSNNRVRRVDVITNQITTVAGDGTCCVTGDGGPATSAKLGNPVRVAFDARGAMLIASEPENAVRLVAAAPLVAVAGGPYSIVEGSSLSLDASATGAGPTATYAWDLDGDAAFDDATGVSPTIGLSALTTLGLADGPFGPVAVAVQVHEGVTTSVGTSTVTVTNASPVATIDAPASATAGDVVTVKVGANDPGPVDAAGQFTYLVDWDGDGVFEESVTGPADPPVTHTYAAAGAKNFTVVAIDKDDARSAPAVSQIVIAAVATTTTMAPTTTTTASTLPPTTTAPATTVPPTLTMPSGDVLPATGGNPTWFFVIGALVMVVGVALLRWRPRLRRS